MSRRGWWSRHTLPPEHWDERDWRDEWRSQRYQSSSGEPVIVPTRVAPTWPLITPGSDKEPGTSRSRRVDRILKSLGR
jgi:hypothetical protein